MLHLDDAEGNGLRWFGLRQAFGARAVQTRRNLDFKSADEIGKLDAAAIEAVRKQALGQIQKQ